MRGSARVDSGDRLVPVLPKAVEDPQQGDRGQDTTSGGEEKKYRLIILSI